MLRMILIISVEHTLNVAPHFELITTRLCSKTRAHNGLIKCGDTSVGRGLWLSVEDILSKSSDAPLTEQEL